MSIALVGLMGTGKTTVGRLLSQLTGFPITDSDSYLVQRFGQTAAQTVLIEGVDALHDREAEHALKALSGPSQIIAAGSSVVEDPAVRIALKTAFVAWLDAPADVLELRLRSGTHRPDFDLPALQAQRAELYRDVADVIVDVAATNPEHTADIIYTAWSSV